MTDGTLDGNRGRVPRGARLLDASSARAQNAHPHVREFALEGLPSGLREGRAASLFSRSDREGDGRRLREALELPADAASRHTLRFDLVHVLRENPGAGGSPRGLIGYACTPGAFRRPGAARLLLERGAAPGWLPDACRRDACAEARVLVEEAPDPGERG